jgi:transposase
LEEVAEGNSRRGAARRFKVGASSAIRWKKRLDATGSAAPAARAGKSRSPPLEAHAPWLLALIAAEPDLSLAELTQRVQAELGQKTSASAMDRFVQRHELSFKNVWPAPSASDFVECAFFSLLQRIRPRADVPGQDGDTRVPVLIKFAASSAIF